MSFCCSACASHRLHSFSSPNAKFHIASSAHGGSGFTPNASYRFIASTAFFRSLLERPNALLKKTCIRSCSEEGPMTVRTNTQSAGSWGCLAE
jgi:hypothetical protein